MGLNQLYNEKKIEKIKNLLQKDLEFKEIVFQKENVEDLYFIAFDNKGNKDGIRVKPQLGTVFMWSEGRWNYIKGFKLK